MCVVFVSLKGPHQSTNPCRSRAREHHKRTTSPDDLTVYTQSSTSMIHPARAAKQPRKLHISHLCIGSEECKRRRCWCPPWSNQGIDLRQGSISYAMLWWLPNHYYLTRPVQWSWRSIVAESVFSSSATRSNKTEVDLIACCQPWCSANQPASQPMMPNPEYFAGRQYK